jgi:hypothetical protein
MTKQTTDQPLPEQSGSQAPTVEAAQKAHTRTAVWPTFRAAYTSFLYTKVPPEGLDMSEITRDLQARNDEVWNGDQKQLEAMLTSQAHSLDAMFHALAERAALNLGKNLETTETYLKLAFRAQNQCARTLEALATMKSPSVVIAQQANIARGHQQVNNGAAASKPTRPAKSMGSRNPQNSPNKLLEQTHGERLEPGATATTSGTHPAMAPVGAVNRATDGRRQGRGSKERLPGRRTAHAEID